MNTPVPDNCPECECELYPSHHTRPRPARTVPGRVVLAAGFLTSGVVFFTATAALLLYLPLPVPIAALGACVPALSVGFAGSVLSERLGRVLKMSCRKCPWSASYPAGRRAYGARDAEDDPWAQ